MQATIPPTVVLDDGEFIVDMNESPCVETSSDGKSPAGPGCGFLFHRCQPDPLAFNGLERVGEYGFQDGQWVASIEQKTSVFRAGYVPPALGAFPSRMDAIAALWAARRDAWLLHT